MSWTRLQCRARSAPLFLHDARRHQLGDRPGAALVLQRPAQLRPETASAPRARAARSLRPTHPVIFKSDLSRGREISRADQARSNLAPFSERGAIVAVTR